MSPQPSLFDAPQTGLRVIVVTPRGTVFDETYRDEAHLVDTGILSRIMLALARGEDGRYDPDRAGIPF